MKIILDREKCIGCGSCVALCPKYWKMGTDGKSDLTDGVKNKETGKYEITTGDLACNEEAADACPVQIIEIIK